MKIIDNKKDYYDYVSGIYGIDPYVVYDRRGSVGPNYFYENLDWAPMFSKEILPSDKVSYNGYGRNAFLEKVYDIIIEAGDKHFYIECVRRRKTETSPVELTYKLYDPVEHLKEQYKISLFGRSRFLMDRYKKELDSCMKKRSEAPLAIFYKDYSKYWDNNHGMVENPILKDLPITGLIPAEEIWQGIYDYILKKKEPVIVDSRTNDEHIESAGFDKKTSFRNVK